MSDPNFILTSTPNFLFTHSTGSGNIADIDLFDIDNDGDLDAFVGEPQGSTLFFENIGSANDLRFAAPAVNPFGLSDIGYTPSPTFADIDGDGDSDALVGDWYGDTYFFENIGSANDLRFAAPVVNPFGLSSVGFFVQPIFVDIDGDGDIDAFFGERTGNIFFFENTGSASNPSFAAPVVNPFGLRDNSIAQHTSYPTFIDIDGDGDLDALVSETGRQVNIFFFENTGSASNPSFAAPVVNPFGLRDIGIALSPVIFADIDGDGDIDALVGGYPNKTFFFLNTAVNNSNNLPTGSVNIDDITPEQGQTLVASNDLVDIDGLGTITYQWKTDRTVVGVGDTYKVTAGDIGKTITVTANYTDGLGNVESVSSLATSEVKSPPPSAKDIFMSALYHNEEKTNVNEIVGLIRVMADLSKAAYHLEPHETGNNFASKFNDPSAFADAAYDEIKAQGWQPLDLDLPLTDGVFGYTTHEGGVLKGFESIRVKNGLSEGFYNNGNAAAFVAHSSDAVVISFRGTNDNRDDNLADSGNRIKPDQDHWGAPLFDGDGDMADHYQLLKPLIDKFDSYVSNNSWIKKVYVTGHSLGGAVAIEYMMKKHPDDNKYQAITFAAPAFTRDGDKTAGDRAIYEDDVLDRIIQIEISEDPTPQTWDVLSGVNRPGDVIRFAGNQTLDEPDQFLAFFANKANHSMDYYRQIVDSVDADGWLRIRAEPGDQTVLFGGDQVGDDFIVDGYVSGSNIQVLTGDDILKDVDLDQEDFDQKGEDKIEIYYGGRGDDTITGGGRDELLLGGPGNDILKGEGGSDRLFGDAGNDTLYGDSSLLFSDITKLHGGLDDDTYVIKFRTDEVIEDFNEGDDTVESFISYTLPNNVENLVLKSGNEHNATGNQLNNILVGNDNSNILKGMDGNDILHSLGGQRDWMEGGAGIDRFVFGNETHDGNRRELDIITDYEVGIDVLLLNDGASIALERQISSGVLLYFDGSDRDMVLVQGDSVVVGSLTIISDTILGLS